MPHPDPGVAAKRRRGKILIVDDDPLAARVVTRVLAREHDVLTVRSGREAMERLRAGDRYDLVLCDVMMPEMTGMQLHGAVSDAGLDVAERMVFMTGGAVTDEARAFAATLPARWLEKPFDAETLRAMARKYVR